MKSDQLGIRSMQEHDLAAVLTIEAASFQTPWKKEHFQHEMTAAHSYPFVAELQGRLAGYVCLMSLFEEAQILDIAVDPEFRGRGVADALLKHTCRLAREKGAEFMALEVRSNNHAAIALYEKLGFRQVGLRSKYYDGRDDAVLMEKSLI